MKEGDFLAMTASEVRQGFIEPSLVQNDIGAHLRKLSPCVKRSLLVCAKPILRQSFERVETVHGSGQPDPFRNGVDRPTSPYAKFKDQTYFGHMLEGVKEHLVLMAGLECILHMAVCVFSPFEQCLETHGALMVESITPSNDPLTASLNVPSQAPEGSRMSIVH